MDRPTRLMIDFRSPEGVAEFVEAVQDLFPVEVGAFEADSLDYSARSGGVGRKHTYILRDVRTDSGRKRMTYQKEVAV